MPISLHSITGMGAESRLAIKHPLDRYLRTTVLCHEVQRTLVVLIFSGGVSLFVSCPGEAPAQRILPASGLRHVHR
jgi:hypothetical protein